MNCGLSGLEVPCTFRTSWEGEFGWKGGAVVWWWAR